MKRFSLIIFVFIIASCQKHSINSNPPKGEDYLSFTENGSWCWFSDPRAIYYEGKFKRTYAGWIDSEGNVSVGYFDHTSHKIESTIIHKKLEPDDHNNPSLFIDNSGHLFVLYSKHATNEPIHLLKTSNPEDIFLWEPEQLLALNDTSLFSDASDTYTYTNIFQLSEEKNKLYLFWRGTDFKPNFSTSADNGKTWEKGKILILPDRIYNNRRPYIKISSNNINTIHFAFTDGHPRNEPTNSIYYAKYKNDFLTNANGDTLKNWEKLPLDPKNSDLVYDAKATGEKAWIWDVAENTDGNPVIVYTQFPNDSSHVYYYAIWDNNQWNNYKLVNSGGWFPHTPNEKTEPEPNYSGGVILDHTNPSIVYLSRIKNGIFEIEKWETRNNGIDWEVEEITSQSKNNNVRPFVIRNYNDKDSLQVLWLNVEKYVHYTNYKTAVKMNIK